MSGKEFHFTNFDTYLSAYVLDYDGSTYQVANEPWRLVLLDGPGDEEIKMSRANIVRRVLADINN